MNVLSLFDGISCARVALDRAGIHVDKYFSSEIDKYAIQIAQKNYPHIQHIGCVNDVFYKNHGQLVWGNYIDGDKQPRGYLDIVVDLIIGGSPCQDLSIAKKDRQGLEGKRSSLFREYVRLLREVKPKYFILENVASMRACDREIITKEMGVEPIMINASLVSAQNRKRLFWTNIPGVTQPEDRGILLKDILETEWCEKEKSNTVRSSGRGSGVGDKHNRDQYIVQRGRGFNKGNTFKEKSPTLSSNAWEQNNKISDGQEIRKITPIECERLQGLPDNYTEGVSNTQRYKMLGNAFNVDVIAHILSFIPKGNR